MPTDLDPIAVLRRTDPGATRPTPERPPLDVLASLPDAPVTPAGPRRSRAVVLAAAAVLAALLAGAAVVATRAPDDLDGGPTATTTTQPGVTSVLTPTDLGPAEPAASQLLALADRAAADPALVGPGPVAYSHTVERNILLGTTSDRAATIEFVARERETWIEPDGTGRRSERFFPADGPDVVLVPDHERYDGPLATFPPFDGRGLARPQGQEAVLADLRVSEFDVPEAMAVLERLAEIQLRQPVAGPDRAALYRALATVEGIEYRGEVDIGRSGARTIAFSTTHDEDTGAVTEHVVIVDAITGALVQQEEVWLEVPPAFSAPEPLVVHRAWLVGLPAMVGAVGDRP